MLLAVSQSVGGVSGSSPTAWSRSLLYEEEADIGTVRDGVGLAVIVGVVDQPREEHLLLDDRRSSDYGVHRGEHAPAGVGLGDVAVDVGQLGGAPAATVVTSFFMKSPQSVLV